MKILAGMGCIDDYIPYTNAGAKEIFVGYVPMEWMEEYGMSKPINRREVMYYNVQIGSESELMILAAMREEVQVPITIALNALHFEKAQYPLVMATIKRCKALGFYDFILADVEFIEALSKDTELMDKLRIHVSGEYSELNPGVLERLAECKVTRIIFPRQTMISEMKTLIERFPQLEYEAFALNEKCHYTGAYCNSVHCDELCHMCKIPYKLFRADVAAVTLQENIKDCEAEPEAKENKASVGTEPESKENKASIETEWQEKESMASTGIELQEQGILGETGCGLCALWKLQDAGLQYLKLVSRGNGSEETEMDIAAMHKALASLEKSSDEKSYIQEMKATLFPKGCSRNCYYME